MLLHVQMPTIVGILTCIGINFMLRTAEHINMYTSFGPAHLCICVLGSFHQISYRKSTKL